jgi:hypothetical protein
MPQTEEIPNEQITFFIQTSHDIQGVVTPQADLDKFVKATGENLNKIKETIRHTAKIISDTISNLPLKPKEFECEFGISLGGEAGIPFVTKGSIETNFKVTLKWVNE